MSSFINKDYNSFFKSCNKVIYELYIDNNIDIMYICYEIIAKLILKIKIINKKRSSYIDFISAVKSIQKYVTRVFLNSKYVFYVFYKIRGYAKYIGDIRTIYYVDLSLGAYNAISNDIKKILKNHELMTIGVEGIFSLKDEELILQYADLISLFYMLNGEFKKNISFYASIAHKLSNSQEERSVLIRTTFFASLCALYTTMYKKADYFIINSMKYIDNATLFEKKLIYSVHGYIYILMKDEEKASEVFLKVYNMVSYEKSFAHKIFISYFIYFICTRKNDKYKKIMNNIINNNYIEYTYMFNPCYFEFITSKEMREMFRFNYNKIVENIKNGMKLPFPIVKAMSMRVYGYFLFYEFNRKKEAEEYILNSIDICKSINAHSEYAKGCILLADIYEYENDNQKKMYYLNNAWYHYVRTHQPEWPKKYENLNLKNSFESHLSIIYCRNFFLNLRYQNFFGYNQSIYTKILKCIILTFPLEKGIFIRYSNNKVYIEACEDVDKDIFLSEKFEHNKDMNKAISSNKYVIVSKSKKTYESYIADIDVYFFIPFIIDGEKYLIYCCGEMRGRYDSTLSQEFFDIITEYIITEITNQKQKKQVVPVKQKLSDNQDDEQNDYIYRSVEMKTLIHQADRIAAKDTTVLLLGESGVGKEVLARRIHQQSGRSGAFVGVNIASTPQELFESEFYGHEKGSFTGANYQKKGLFELADNGTLFIDEVGDIPIPLQIKLLRVLQERQFMRVGGTKLIRSNFRLVAATNRNLLEKVQNGTFREDLYYRLNVVPINIPPLRERPEDIRALAQFFLEHFSRQYDMEIRPFPQLLREKMLAYGWPGNVRQLKNFVERYCLYMDSDLVTFTTIDEHQKMQKQQSDADGIFDRDLTVRELNDAYFEHVFKKKNGVISGKNSVISVLGISKPTAHAWMNRLHLREKYNIKLVSEDSES